LGLNLSDAQKEMAMTLWGGRFTGATDEAMRRFSNSIAFDWRLYAVDVQGSVAYTLALARAGLITAQERDDLVAGLQRVREEFATGAAQLEPSDEDIHTVVERRLREMVGSVAGKLHTGRSRNDQVATDLRLYLMREIAHLRQALLAVQEAIVKKAQDHVGVVMPGYTHTQQAQPILFSHWLMSFFWKLERDKDRLRDAGRRTAMLPLGAGALAGNPFEIDRQEIAAELGFDTVTQNSIDAVGDRDYVVEFLASAALLQVHLSTLAEDLIWWSSREFGFVRLADAYCTGSSLMPQKRNPDSLELMRGKTGRVVGHLAQLLVVLKGLPSGYNKDLQEDKEALFQVLDTLRLQLPIAADVIRTLQVNAERMAEALDDSMLATDLADYLVRKCVPFRESHYLVGQAVKRAEDLGVPLRELPLEEYLAVSAVFGVDLYAVFDFRQSVERRSVEGGTATAAVLTQIERAKALLAVKDTSLETGG
jgi:argininosuccinate lyase